MKDLNYYLALKYPMEIVETEDGFVASHPDLPGCASFGDTALEAIESLGEVRQLWLKGQVESQGSAPEPRPPEEYSGRFVVRLPKWLHRLLDKEAQRQACSLNTLVVSVLAKGATDKTSEAVSWQLCQSLEQMRGQLADLCGAPRIFVRNLQVGETMRYSIQGFTKNVPRLGLKGLFSSVEPESSTADDEEVLGIVYNRFPARFESKIQMGGKKR
jgi:antitoxin HicB